MGRGKSLRDFADHDDREQRDDEDDRWRGAEAAAFGDDEYAGDADDESDDAAIPDSRHPRDSSRAYAAVPPTDHTLAPMDDDHALAPVGDSDDLAPVIIPGTGMSMGNPFIRRRERPLTMRLAIITLMACITVTGLFAVTPLGTSAQGDGTSFQALAGVLVWRQDMGYHWIVAQWGDSVESIAARYHVQIGGIYEMNGLLAGQDITIGKEYKVPDDPNYGANFRPASIAGTATGNGSTIFGNSPWTSFAGTPPPEASCGPNGNGVPTAYQLKAPDVAAVWVRGFTWYHNGVDLAAPDGNPIHPAQTGQVIWAGWDFGGLGYSVKINHCNGIATMYGHMQKVNVTAGENVTPNDIIGWEGATGWATGPHCHFMVEVNNVPVDPMAYYGYSDRNITGNPIYG